MPQEQHIYAVTRVHSNELNLLSRQDIEQLISARDAAEAFRMLHDKGWSQAGPSCNAEAALEAETQKTWNLIEELTGDVQPFNVFRYGNDYHNLKAAVKLAYTGTEGDTEGYFLPFGTVPVDVIVKAAKEHDFTELPPAMAQTGRKAYEALADTGSGQACDMVIDKAALAAIDEAGRQSDSELLRRYAQLRVDGANIKAAVRCCVMKKSPDFIDRAIAEAGTLDTGALKKAAAESMDAIYAYLKTTAYEGAVPALKTSMADFERWCDDELIELIRPQRFNYFGIEPLAAFLLGRQNEIGMVRLVLSAKMNDLSSEALRQRLREMYVD